MPRGGSHQNNKLHYLIGTNKCRRASGQLHGGFGNFSKYSSWLALIIKFGPFHKNFSFQNNFKLQEKLPYEVDQSLDLINTDQN